MAKEITIIQPDRIIRKSGNEETVIPTHGREYDLVGWEIYDYPYLSKMGIVEQPTRELAEKEYWKNLNMLKRHVKSVPVWIDPKGKYYFAYADGRNLRKLSFEERIKICPLCKWKESLFNPYFVGWKEGYTPKNGKSKKQNI